MRSREMKRIDKTQYKSPQYYDNFISNMRKNQGINIPESTKTVKCPYCGFVFNIIYGRAIACSGCSKAATGCKLARCPKCDKDFSITNTMSNQGLNKMAESYKKFNDY
ncbi:MAG: hypothetical protein JW825_06695 [Candidatus Methanofastidiosa archaeon]|nr:hypothetical protein [Candidatus Methanofastidiosa archaeon]